MISKKKKTLALAALAAVACLLAPRPAWPQDGDDSTDTPAGRFVRRVEPDRTTLTLPCGVVVVRRRDDEGHDLGLTATRGAASLLDLRHDWTDGRRALTRRDAVETAYVHDEAGLLTGVLGASATFVEHQVFGDMGLRVAFERDGEAEVWTRGDAGRLVAAGERRVRHDAAGRVVEVAGPPGDVGPTWRVRYVRDGRGRVTALEREERAGPTTTRRARPTRLGPAEPLGGGRERTWLRLPGEPAPVAYADGGVWTFLVADARGSVLLYLDAAGAVLGEADFSPWGELSPSSVPGERPLVWRGGRVVDPEHLVWLEGRAYSPSLGQWLEPPYGFDPEAGARGLADRLDGH